ncbi:hypothetical protein [Luteimonas kalidii]|uniref:PepSY domain-containing protein n=1 Tax=Luteimonas kalidii TaxID=3042025 RepID=A0ABT6JTT9_9GAMM|nr:hypothetical protein [Luteimonas kalidii]MDH5833566.1 hypothetical protein [Luteimonas kalidii]
MGSRTVFSRATRSSLCTLVLALAVASGAFANPSNKWRVEMDGRAKVDGEIELSLTPEGGPSSTVVIAIPKGTGENSVARLTRDALRQHFGKDVYHVEVDDGEDVLVKKRGSTRDFDLVVVRNTVDGLRIHLQRE